MLPAQIAKTLSLRVGDRYLLVITRGDARLDNKKAMPSRKRTIMPSSALSAWRPKGSRA